MPLLKRSTGIISKYILGEFLKWFALSLAFFFAAFFVNNILLLAKDILSTRVPLGKVLSLLLYTFPVIFSYSLPFSILLATIVSMVQHNAHHELLAMRSAGISLSLCYLPIMLLALLFTVISFGVNDYLLPRSSVQFVRLYQDILFSAPGLELEPYSIRRYEDNIIVTQAVAPDGKLLYNPLIIQSSDADNQRRIIAGESARLLVDDEGGVLRLILDQVQGHSYGARDFAAHEYFFAKSLSYNILLFALSSVIRPLTAREMPAVEVKAFLDREQDRVRDGQMGWQKNKDDNRLHLAHLYLDGIYRIADEAGATTATTAIVTGLETQYQTTILQADEPFLDTEYRLYQTEYYRKFSLPAACLFLTWFAFPVGVSLRRSNWGIGFGIGLLASVVFWCLLIGGQIIVIQRAQFSPILIMFIPNIVMVVAGGIVLLSKRVRR